MKVQTDTHSSPSLIKLRDIFTEDEYSSFISEQNKTQIKSFFGFNDAVDKIELQKSILNICKNKLKDTFLLKALTWFEQDLTNDTNAKLKAKNSDLQKAINWIETNCTIKPKITYLMKQNSRYAGELTLSIPEIKHKIRVENEEAITNASLSMASPKPENFITFSEESIAKIEQQDFNIFKLEDEIGTENTLTIIGCYIFTSYGFYSVIQYNKLEKFLQEITKGYIRDNPYHNDLHAADVTQTCMIYVKHAKMKELFSLTDLDLMTLYLSCIVHDFKHPGYNNAFLANIHDPVALRYNDASILESYHISQTFKLMRSSDLVNIFSGLSNEDYRTARKRMIGFVLATDMKFHFEQFQFLKNEIANKGIVKGQNKNKICEGVPQDKMFKLQQDYLEIVIHACDISNPTKPFDIYTFWADRVIEEFWRQGDLEKSLGMSVSMNCDRETVTKAQSQIGFMNFIVCPFFASFAEIFNELEFLVENSKENCAIFKKIKEEEDQAKKDKEQKKQ